MTESIKTITKKVGLPRLIISSFFVFLIIASIGLGLPLDRTLTNIIRRFGMFGVLVLAMVPAIQCGIGPNFALPLGIICGILGEIISIEFGFVGFTAFIVAILISIPFATIIGVGYGNLLNKIKGSEMLVAAYAALSVVYFMCIMWVTLPFKHPQMIWPIGKGLRVTIALEAFFGYVLNDFADFSIAGVHIPTGLLMFFLLCCFVVWLYTRSKTGMAMKAAGDNPKFALASGINVDRSRIIGTTLSTILGAVGIIVYHQSYGYIQLYDAPQYMGFATVAAVLIGGATARKAKISHVLLGVLLFQGLLAVALPVANEVVKGSNLAEVLRMVIQNGIILYALTQVVGGE